MKWESIKNLLPEKFRRLTGVKKLTFEKMTEILKEAYNKKRLRGGRKTKLTPIFTFKKSP